MTAADRDTYWDFLETLQWIGARKEGWTTAAGDINKNSRTPLAIFTAEPTLNRHNYDFMCDCEPVSWLAGRKSIEDNESGMGGLAQALNYLLQQVHKRRIRLTAIKCDRYRVKQVPVPWAELGDLEFRITSDHRLTKVGLWSRSRDALIWRSPQFLRGDVIRVWPARKKKSAAVSPAILQHLQTIMTPDVPLTRAEAQRRCLAEVPDAFPEAFKQAWAILHPCYKRGRGRPIAGRAELATWVSRSGQTRD
jgi:hypothetical protein